MASTKKYILGNTNNEYLIGNILLPKHSYDDFERSHGKCPYTEVTEDEYETLLKSNAFNDLVENKFITVLDKLPAFAMTGDERATQFKRQLTNAENKLHEKEDEIETLKARIAVLEAEAAAGNPVTTEDASVATADTVQE